MSDTEIAYYTLPVILSFEGVEKQINSKLGKAFGDVGKKAGKSMADGSEADLKRAGDNYEKLRNRASDALGKVRVEEEKLAKARASGKSDQVVAAEERLNKARRDAARTNREAAASYKDVEDAQRRLGSGAGDLGISFGKLGDLATSAGTALASVGVIAAGAATVGIAAFAAGVVVAGRALYDLGKSWDDVADSIAIKTGTLGPELDKLKNAVKDLAPNTAASIADIGDAVGSVRQSLHLSGMDLEVMSKNIVDLNRLTGDQVNVRSLGKAFRGFGIDVKDQLPALNALYEVSTKTGIPVNDLIGSMVDGGAAARNMGLGFGETAALLATFNDAGLNGDKVLKALGIAAKTLAKDGREPAVGLRETIAEIQNLIDIGNEPLAIAKAGKVFGKGYQDIFDAIKRGAIDSQSLDSALQLNGLSIAQMAAATDDWDQTWQKLQNTLQTALEPIGSGLFNLVNEKLTGLSEWVTQNQSTVIGFFQKVADWAFDAAQSIVSFVADSLRALAGMIEKAAPALADIGDAISWIPGMGKAGDALKDLGGAMKDWPTSIRGTADSIEKTLNPALQKGKDYTHAFMERTKQATRFTELLGDSVATVNDNGQIVLSDNTPEVEQRLKDLGITVTKLPDGTMAVTADTDEATTILDSYREQQQGEPIKLDVGADVSQARKDISDLIGSAIQIPVGITPSGGLLGGAGGAQKFAGSTGPTAGLTENSINAKRAVEANFPQIQTIGGYRPPDVTKFGTFTEHSSGEAIDVMIPNWSSPAGKAYGDRIAQWALSNADALGTEWVIWQQKTFYPDGRVSPMGDRGSPTQNHMDHVHLKTKPGAVPSGMRRFGPAEGTATGGFSIVQGGTLGLQEPSLSQSVDTSGLTPPQGIAGTDAFGNPGYYQTDPKALREGRERVNDAQEAIRQADAAVAQAQARRAEMPIDAEESAILSADESVRASKARAAKARREANDAAADFAETQKGEFTKAKKPKAQSGQSGGGLGGAGSIFGSFLKDTFGVGDWLPALDNLWPLQAADTLMGAFMPTIAAAANGELGAQTPGWYPGMSAEEFAGLKGGTSTAPFGIPDIAAPPMPANGQHGGSGAMPGPGNVINIDNSQNLQGANLGWDPAQVEKQRQSNINRAPRLPVGMGG